MKSPKVYWPLICTNNCYINLQDVKIITVISFQHQAVNAHHLTSSRSRCVNQLPRYDAVDDHVVACQRPLVAPVVLDGHLGGEILCHLIQKLKRVEIIRPGYSVIKRHWLNSMVQPVKGIGSTRWYNRSKALAQLDGTTGQRHWLNSMVQPVKGIGSTRWYNRSKALAQLDGTTGQRHWLNSMVQPVKGIGSTRWYNRSKALAQLDGTTGQRHWLNSGTTGQTTT